MELKDLHITDSFWDFIEANIPDHDKRTDTLRQSELQNFIDGHESTVAGITREEAILLRDNILHRLFAEAIAAFTGETISGSGYLRDYAEALAAGTRIRTGSTKSISMRSTTSQRRSCKRRSPAAIPNRSSRSLFWTVRHSNDMDTTRRTLPTTTCRNWPN